MGMVSKQFTLKWQLHDCNFDLLLLLFSILNAENIKLPMW